MPSILFCTPCYGGMVTAAHFQSCMNLKEELTRQGIAHDWLNGTNESLITRARNEMTASTLGTKHTHMMWIDADIEFSPEDVARLWNLQVDIACGLYPMKRVGVPLAAWRGGKLVDLKDCPSEPFEVEYAGTGFLMLSRRAIETIIAYIDEWERKAEALVEKLLPMLAEDERATLARMLEGMAASYEGPNGRVPALYMTPIHDDVFESEDYHFCRLARQAGFKIIAEPAVRLGHIGQYRYGV